jgi:hypothetical protein
VHHAQSFAHLHQTQLQHPDDKRHLLRMWLSPEDGRPLPEHFAELWGNIEVWGHKWANVNVLMNVSMNTACLVPQKRFACMFVEASCQASDRFYCMKKWCAMTQKQNWGEWQASRVTPCPFCNTNDARVLQLMNHAMAALR